MKRDPDIDPCMWISQTFLVQLFCKIPDTAWKVSKHGLFSGPHFLLFGLNIGKYEPEKTPRFDTFYAMWQLLAITFQLDFILPIIVFRRCVSDL